MIAFLQFVCLLIILTVFWPQIWYVIIGGIVAGVAVLGGLYFLIAMVANLNDRNPPQQRK